MTDELLLTHSDDQVSGTVVERPNRFVLIVELPSGSERVFLGDPGALAFLEPGKEILCSPVDDPDRITAFDAIAVREEEYWVSLKAALANDLFADILQRDILPEFQPYSSITREPELPEHGRTDFRLEGEDTPATGYVEVKSCTHAEGGVAKFPDRPTKRGRRHLRSLDKLAADGNYCHIVFVVQRPDVTLFRPFREVDPKFADLLAEVHDRGVSIRVIVTEFDPPNYYLRETDLPVKGLH